MLNPATYLDAAARRKADAPAAIYDDRVYSFGDLAALSNQVANALEAAGIKAGDRVALLCPNRPGFIAVTYGALKIGAELVLLSTTCKARDIAFQLTDSGAKAFFVYDGHGDTSTAEEMLAILPETIELAVVIPPSPFAKWRMPGAKQGQSWPSLGRFLEPASRLFTTRLLALEQTALILYTSGSTGRPKGVQITAANIAHMVLLNVPLAAKGATARKLVATPLYHILGQVFCLHLSMLMGEVMILVEGFEPDRVWRLMEGRGASHFVHMPIYYKYLLDNAGSVDERKIRETLKLCGTGSSPLPPAWSAEFEARYGQPIVPGYGMTETTAIVTWHSPEDELRIDSVGPVAPGVEVRLTRQDGTPAAAGEEGEICVRSPGVMKGYLNLSAATDAVLQDGWYQTRDLGTFDEDGYLYIRGRADQKIKRGEEHIYPAEIETVLMEHPLVARAAVISVPDAVLGEEAKTLVVPSKPGAITEAGLLAWLERELPDGKCPGVLQFRDHLPTTTLGKIAHAELRAAELAIMEVNHGRP
ncbi:MAG: class I adenylate-forming enzyme family protein [Magnetovibrionaceae bacterium]